MISASRIVSRGLFSLLALAALTLVPAAELSGKDLYVAGSGSDSNAGTQASPYRTIKKALENAAAGDTVFIRAGTYDQSIRTSEITIPSGSSWDDAVTVRAYPGETVVLRPTSSCCVGVINLDSSKRLVSYLVLRNLIIDSSGQPGAYGVRIANGTHHIRLVDVEVKNATGASGITTIGGADFNEFINLNVHSNGSRDNLDHGIYIATSGNLIDGGDYHHNHAYGIHLYGPSNVHKNVVRNARSYNNNKGMVVGSGDDNLVYNNLIYDNPNLGVTIGYGTTRRTRFYNNTIVGSSNTSAVTVLSSASETDVRNNIFWGNGADAVRDLGSGTVAANNLDADPLFMDASARDFRVRTGSPAIDAGATLSQVSIDFDGISRPQGLRFDIGVYEYQSSTVLNQAPVVDAGPDQTVTLPSTASLGATASDDGLPGGGTLSYRWSVVSGTGVSFTSAGSSGTEASFAAAGTYTLRVTVSDGALAASDDVIVTVNAEPAGTTETSDSPSSDTETAPELHLVVSRNGEILKGRFTPISAWSEDARVQKLVLDIDGVVHAVADTNSLEYKWDTQDLEGVHTIRVIAYDPTDVLASTSVTVTVR